MCETVPAPEQKAIAEIYSDLAKAQSEFLPVRKNCTNPHFQNKYADLQAILASVTPALNAHGLVLMQDVSVEKGVVTAVTMLCHKSGAVIKSSPFTISVAQNNAQAIGSARTYACRYSVASMLCIAADDDDDGNGAVGGKNKNGRPPESPESREPPAPFVLTDEHVAHARAIAAGGVDAYKSYFTELPADHQKALRDSGWHKSCFAEAKAVDAEDAPNDGEQ